MSQHIPKMLESFAKGDMNESKRLAGHIGELLRYEKPEAQWHAYDKIASSLIGEGIIWPSYYRIEVLLDNAKFFSGLGKEVFEKAARHNSTLFFIGSSQNKLSSMTFLLEKIELTREEVFDNLHLLQLPEHRLSTRWEYYLSKTKVAHQKNPSLEEKKKIFAYHDGKYIALLNQMGLSANLKEYLKFAGKEKKPETIRTNMPPSKIISEIKEDLVLGKREHALALARELDVQMGAKLSEYSVRLEIKEKFIKEIYGIPEVQRDLSASTLVENFFFLRDIGIEDPRTFIFKSPTILGFTLRNKWGTLNYLVLEMNSTMEDIYQNPSRLSLTIDRLIPRHLYYINKGRTNSFGRLGIAPIGPTALSKPTDEEYIKYLRKGKLNASLEEYLQFKETKPVTEKLNIYLTSNAPMPRVKQKIERIIAERADPFSTLPNKRN